MRLAHRLLTAPDDHNANDNVQRILKTRAGAPVRISAAARAAAGPAVIEYMASTSDTSISNFLDKEWDELYPEPWTGKPGLSR